MLKSTQGTSGAETVRRNTPTTEAILLFTATALVSFLMIYLALFDGAATL